MDTLIPPAPSDVHASDCAIYNEPAMPNGPCNCHVSAGLPPIGVTVPRKLHPPIDMSRVKDEKGVKGKIKELLNAHGWFTWMPGANGFGQQGVSDHLCLKDGVFLAIEAKFGTNKPKPLQKAFAAQIIANDGFAFCVNERNIDHLAWWFESFELAKQHQMRGEEVSTEHGSRMLNAISVLTDAFAE